MAPTCHIELQLLRDGAISLQGDIQGRYFCAAEALRPADALRLLEEWLQHQDYEPIVIVVCDERDMLAAWNTQSSSFALYWAAAVLGNLWNPGVEHEGGSESVPPLESGPPVVRSVSQRVPRVQVSEPDELESVTSEEDVA